MKCFDSCISPPSAFLSKMASGEVEVGGGGDVETHLVTSGPFLAVPWSSCPGPSPGLEVAEGGVPPWSRPLKTLAGGTPVLLVMLRHAWWGSWRAPLHFGSCRHVSPLGLCHVLRPAHSLAG